MMIVVKGFFSLVKQFAGCKIVPAPAALACGLARQTPLVCRPARQPAGYIPAGHWRAAPHAIDGLACRRARQSAAGVRIGVREGGWLALINPRSSHASPVGATVLTFNYGLKTKKGGNQSSRLVSTLNSLIHA
ncbi:hypothetical protein PGT21_013336 [Puccinia graminis f. sp. tritici]|uniref:Uncharacterized protein n=1 Tax=Puccinia graminis f. sp. tritici TaxID=56615 RepID=A0A5B0MRC0_PUCGR|nr:hypothetical protein PGT21_013336 [Puccinia graminis f. sp. tritici]